MLNFSEPYLNCNFFVEIRGMWVGGFTQVSGLGGELEVREFREGGLNSYTRKLPGPAKYPSNITLRHGVTEFDMLWRWYRDAANGDVRRHNGSIIMLRRDGIEYLRWNFVQAFPVRWEGPEFDAMNPAVAISSFELAHNGIRRLTI
jgi:phage tail-like protein